MSEVRRRRTADTDSGSDIDSAQASRRASLVDAQAQQPSNLKNLQNVIPVKSPRWRNWWVRGILTWTMLILFYLIVSAGPGALSVMVLLFQLKCFHEIVSIGHHKWPRELPWFRSLNWYFLMAANYFLYGENFSIMLLQLFAEKPNMLKVLRHHRLISFCLYIIGFCTFVLCLRKGYYKLQFKQFGWTHLALLLIVTTSHIIIRNIYRGLIWFLLPSSLVICNDIMAYMFGFFFGKTPLISLSPKKTWEGFLGAFASTLVFSVFFAWALSLSHYFICPFDHLSLYESTPSDCEPDSVFQWTTLEVPARASELLSALTGITITAIPVLPIMIHGAVMSVFASLIAPFGGFFASGLKRAFKLKDFDDIIPGHGGLMDRFDCQFVMAFFAFVYYESFIRAFRVDELVRAVMTLPPDEQLRLLQTIQERIQQP